MLFILNEMHAVQCLWPLKRDSANKVQILDEALCISHREMYAFNYFPAGHRYILEQTGLFNLGVATSLKRRYKIQTS